MAKKTKQTLDDFNFDDELNFDDFDNFDQDFNPEATDKKSRNPVQDVFKGTVSGATSKLKDPAFLARVTRNALPDQFGEVFDRADEITTGVSTLYDEATRELKPQLANISKKIDNLVPENAKTMKTWSKKIAEYFGAYEEKLDPTSDKSRQDSAIANELQSIFGKQEELRHEQNVREDAKDQLNERIEQKRFNSNFGLLNSINENITSLNNYTLKVTQAYQKKSLELQYRSYFVQSELLSSTRKYSEIFNKQNESIVKNTALPEAQKIRMGERFKDRSYNKFIDKTGSYLFGQGGVFDPFLKNLQTETKAFTNKLKEGMSRFQDILDPLADTKEMMDSMGGDIDLNGYELGGEMLGSYLADVLGDKVAKPIKDKLAANKAVMEKGYKFSRHANELPAILAGIGNKDIFTDTEWESGPRARILQGAAGFLNLFKERAPDTRIQSQYGNKDLDNPVEGIDNRFYRSVTEVIPGYLSRILRETIVARTNDNSAGLLNFDFNSGKFVTQEKTRDIIRSTITDNVKRSGINYNVDELYSSLTGGQDLSPEEQKQIKEFLLNIAKTGNMEFTPENILKTSTYSKLSPNVSAKIKDSFDRGLSSDTPEKFKAGLSSGLRGIRKSIPDFRADIEQFVRLGYSDLLINEGYITDEGNGSYSINMDKYYETVNNQVVTSDINAKENIRSFSPKRALEGIKKTKIFNWLYKKGRGDNQLHTGPMAQDVNKNLGEEAAPTGKTLDLTTMNGVNMAAIQALADEQSKLKGKTDTKPKGGLLAAIKADTSEIVKLLSSGVSTGSSGTQDKTSNLNIDTSSYSGILKGISKLSFGLVSKSANNVIDIGKQGLDKVNSVSSKIYDKLFEEKDEDGKTFANRVYEGGKSLVEKSYSLAQNFISQTIPNSVKKLQELGQKATKWIKENITGPMDVYIKGQVTPALTAELMKMGYYRDVVSGKVIRTVEDLKDLKGDIVDATGNVCLKLSDLRTGLVDKYGNDLKSFFSKVLHKAAGLATAGALKAKDFALGMFGKLKELDISGMWDNIKESMSGWSMGDFGFVGKKTYDVLAEIRDILKTHLGEADPKLSEAQTSEAKVSQASRTGWLNKFNPKNWIKRKESTDATAPMPTKQMDLFESSSQSSTPDYTNRNPSLLSNLSKLNPKGWISKGLDKIKDIKKPMSFGASPLSSGTFANLKDKVKDSKIGSMIKGKGKGLGNILGKSKGLLGTAVSGAGGLFNRFFGSDEETDETTQTAKPEETKVKDEAQPIQTPVAQKPQYKPTFNDRDGSGRRDGDWRDRLEKQAAEKAAKSKKADLTPDDPRYKSDKSLFGMIKSMISGVTSGIGGLFGIATDALGLLGGKGIGKVLGTVLKTAGFTGKMIGGALGLGAKAITRAAKPFLGAAKAIGTPLAKGVQLASKIPGIAGAVKAAGTLRTAAGVGSILTGGAGSAILGAASGAVTALGAALTSPLFMGAAAIAGTAYGAYKLYKYMTRNKVDQFENIRFRQYGLNFNEAIAKENHRLITLEAYLLDGRVHYRGAEAQLLGKEIKEEDILEIFDIDKGDTSGIEQFNIWFFQRFVPVFLKHVSSANVVNGKVKLNEISKLTPSEQLEYLKKISYESGPYNVTASPLKELSAVSTDRKTYLSLIEDASNKLAVKIYSKAPTDKIPKVTPPPAAPTFKDQVEKTNQKSVNPYASNKAKDNKDSGPSGEDGNTIKDTRTGSNVASQVANVGKVAMAAGPQRDGEQGYQYLKLQPGAKIDTMNPDMKKLFLGMAQEYGELTGKSIQINSGTRTSAEQEALWRKDPRKAARPGRSLHEFGLAVDIQSADANELDKLGLMKKYGFTRPVGGETWHVEPAGIQTNLNLAKNNPLEATKMIVAGKGRGGGGYGSTPADKKGGRNDQLAKSLLGIPPKPTLGDMSKSETVLSVNTRDPLPSTPGGNLPSASKQFEARSEAITAIQKAADSSKAEVDAQKQTKLASSITAGYEASKREALPEAEPKPANDQIKSSGSTDESGVKGIITDAARMTGTDPKIMQTIAAVESSLNPNAKSSKGSASGLFQFTNSTWNEQISKNGKKYGLDASTSPFDPKANSLMAGEYIKTNYNSIKKVKSDPNAVDVYLAHFLGAGGARRFLRMPANQIAALAFPDAASSNPNIFYDGNRPLTVGEIYKNTTAKLNKRAQEFGIGTINASLPTSKANTEEQLLPPINTNIPSMPTAQPDKSIPVDKPAVSTKPSIVPRDNSILATNPTTGPSSEAMTGESLNNVNGTLIKSHGVLLQIHEVLRGIFENTNPDNLQSLSKGIMKAVETVGAEQSPTKPSQRGYRQDKPYVDISRKTT